MGMIFGTRAQPSVTSCKFPDDFRKMDLCKTAACMGAWPVHFRKMEPCRTEACMGPPHSEILCGAALPEASFSRKNRSLGFCNLKQCFLHSTNKIFNGTRLDRRGLKNECVGFQYGTKFMARKFKS